VTVVSRAVPLLPAADVAAVSQMWQSLGFAVQFELQQPRPYVALQNDNGLELHYFGVDDAASDTSGTAATCVFIVLDPAELVDEWQPILAAAEGGARLVVPRSEAAAQQGFSLIDSSGNRIRVMRAAPLETEPVDAPDVPVASVEPQSAVLAAPDPSTAVTTLGAPSEEPGDEALRVSAYERHGLAAAPHHRFSALIYLAELSVRLDRLEDARSHLASAEEIIPDSPAVADVRAELDRRTAQLRADRS